VIDNLWKELGSKDLVIAKKVLALQKVLLQNPNHLRLKKWFDANSTFVSSLPTVFEAPAQDQEDE
jgi:hypothetical protein